MDVSAQWSARRLDISIKFLCERLKVQLIDIQLSVWYLEIFKLLQFFKYI